MNFRVIIAGGRDFDDYQLLELNCNCYLKNKFPDIEIVSGKAKGADRLGERYAENYLLDVKEFSPDWDKFGKGAGFIRNREMAEYADALIAFWSGSRGTSHMIDIMKKMGKLVRIVRY